MLLKGAKEAAAIGQAKHALVLAINYAKLGRTGYTNKENKKVLTEFRDKIKIKSEEVLVIAASLKHVEVWEKGKWLLDTLHMDSLLDGLDEDDDLLGLDDDKIIFYFSINIIDCISVFASY